MVTVHKELDKEVSKYFVSGGFAFVHPDSTADICAVEAVKVSDLDVDAVRAGLQVGAGWQGFQARAGCRCCAMRASRACVGLQVGVGWQGAGWMRGPVGGWAGGGALNGVVGGAHRMAEHCGLCVEVAWLCMWGDVHCGTPPAQPPLHAPLPTPRLPTASCPYPLPPPLQEYTNKLAALQGKADDYEVAAAQVRVCARASWCHGSSCQCRSYPCGSADGSSGAKAGAGRWNGQLVLLSPPAAVFDC